MEVYFLLLPPHSGLCLMLMVSVSCWWFTEKQLFCQRNAFPKSEIPLLNLINLIQDPPIIKLTALFLITNIQSGGQRISSYISFVAFYI